MKSKSLIDKVLKKFYGIDGILDEYKKEQINKIGNLIFIFMWWYLIISTFVATLLVSINRDGAILFLIIGNLIVVLLSIIIVTVFLRRKKLDLVEVEKKDYLKLKRKYLVKGIFLAGYFGVSMYILNALDGAFEGEGDFWSEITSFNNLQISLVEGFLFGMLMYLYFMFKLRKR
ncbi:MAG: DUF3278 domain-containing protein [Liquorilactobacillus nagelii]|uniref:DUF3278 domain-containing protein n=2 Tax=Liquorilactobacillus nagelii TaxID=82688 RepID=A0A3Q8CB88_9LACO|nr:DUF3278 domain-containing protein [Liquorilactobacillus nagelii]AUJ31384.1 hypothetical protein BSQ50_01670 [Liquorilactobacillus nagelii]MCC7616801.1 hypothetical protein [Liquorilactobacillus nagelii]MCP9315607.1 DUF3278 domain-containing protein [Liquorilactobacillus nagelii]